MDQTYKIKNFFSDSVLTYGKINGLPRPVDAKDVTATAADVVEFKTTKEGFIKNVTNIYDFLKSKNFQYLGTEGEVLSTFFGGMPDYAFYECEELSDYRKISDNGEVLTNHYIFVWADSLGEGDYLVDDCTLDIIGREENSEEVYVTMEITGDWVLTSHYYKEYKSLPIGYLFPWLRENYLKDISQIKIEITTLDPQVGSLKEIAYSNSERFISLNMLSPYVVVNEVECEDALSPYSEIITYQLTNNSGETYSLQIIDNLIFADGKYYEIEPIVNTINADIACFSFITNMSQFDIYHNDEIVGKLNDLAKLEFTKYELNVKKESEYYIMTDFGKAYILNERAIYVYNEETKKYVCYEIVGDLDFSSIITN